MWVNFSGGKRYEGVRFNVISVMSEWVGVQFPGNKHYVTLEWPPNFTHFILRCTRTAICTHLTILKHSEKFTRVMYGCYFNGYILYIGKDLIIYLGKLRVKRFNHL